MSSLRGFLTVGFFLIAVQACGGSASSSESPGTGALNSLAPDPIALLPAGDFAPLYERLHFLPIEDDALAAPAKRAPDLRASKILKKIHPYLVVGKGLELKRMGGGWDVLFIKRGLPSTVWSAIEAKAMNGEDSGFLLLQDSFWKEIRSEMSKAKAYRFGFIENSPETVAGVYFGQEGALAFDVFSNSKTLVHELRHAEQASRDKVPGWFARRGVTDTCRSQIRSYLGEFDSTQQQLEGWAAPILAYHSVPRDLAEAERVGTEYQPTLIRLFLANLAYPVDASGWVLAYEDCPDSVLSMIASLKALADEQYQSFRTGPLLQIDGVRNTATEEFLDGSWTEEKSIEALDRSKLLKEQITGEINLASKNRKARSREILNRLKVSDLPAYRDLCEHVGAFQLLTGCGQ
jgi:hypothetical protein